MSAIRSTTSILKTIQINNRTEFDLILKWLGQQQYQPKWQSSTLSSAAELNEDDKSFQLFAGSCLIYRLLHGKSHHAISDTIQALHEICQYMGLAVSTTSLPYSIRTFLLHVVDHKTNKLALKQLTDSLSMECHHWINALTVKLVSMLDECHRMEHTYADFDTLYTAVALQSARHLHNLQMTPETTTKTTTKTTTAASMNQKQRIQLLAWKLACRLHRHQQEDSGAAVGPLWRPKRLLASAAVLGCLTLLPEFPVNTNAEGYASPILTLHHLHRSVNARLRCTTTEEMPTTTDLTPTLTVNNPGVDRITVEVLRGEIVKLTKELQVVLNDLKLKNMLTTVYPVGLGEGYPPPWATSAMTYPVNANANLFGKTNSGRASFLRELVGPAAADELLWYMPDIVERLHEDDSTAYIDLCCLVQDHVPRYLDSSAPTPSTIIASKETQATAPTKALPVKQQQQQRPVVTGEPTSAHIPAVAKPTVPPKALPVKQQQQQRPIATEEPTSAQIPAVVKPVHTPAAAAPPAAAPPAAAPPAPPAEAMEKTSTPTAKTTDDDVAAFLEATSAPPTELIELAVESLDNLRAKQRSASSSSSILLEAMELNEWAVSLSFIEVVKPSTALMDVLEHSSGTFGGPAVLLEWQDVILHRTLNKSLLRLSQEHLRDAKATRKAPVSVQTGAVAAGVVQVHGGELTPDKQLCKIVVAFYYHCLEAVLYCETKRTKKLRKREKRRKYHSYENQDMTTTTTRRSCSHLILNPSFHAALLACCTLCVTHAVGCTPTLRPCAYLRRCDILTILHVTSTTPYEFLKVSETVRRALAPSSPACGKIGSPLVFALPKVLQRLIQQTEVHILDSLVWARSNDNTTTTTTVTVDGDLFCCLPDIIDDWMEKSSTLQHLRLWPPRELDLPEEEKLAVSNHDTVVYPGPDHDSYAEIQSAWYVLRKLMNITENRIQAICQKLGIVETSGIPAQMFLAFRYLLRHRLELLYDRHVDQWVLCCVYGVCRALDYRRRPAEPQADTGTTPISFADIIAAYVELRQGELGSVVCQRIVRRIQVQSFHPREASASTGTSGNHHSDGVGDIIALYNQVFVPALKEHLLASPSLQKLKAELEEQESGDIVNNLKGVGTNPAREKRADQGRFNVTVDSQRHQREFLTDAGNGPVVYVRLGGGILSAFANEFTGRKRKMAEA